MSYEGHTKVLCANGHLSVFDAHSMPVALAFPGHVEWRCPTCKAEKAWSADVDQTNGIDSKTGLCPGDVKLRVKNGHACICPTCGKKHACAKVQYHIPKWCVQTAKEAVDLGLRRQGRKIGDRVKWKSQSRSYWTTKVCTIVAVVPPGSNPVIPEGFKGNSSTGYGLCGRKNESYLVKVDGKGNRLYWPTASLKAI